MTADSESNKQEESNNQEENRPGLTVLNKSGEPAPKKKVIALIGNPNAGKTSLFNSLTGLKAKTANFPGTTVDFRQGNLKCGDDWVDLIDLPGAYSLHPSSPEEEVAAEFIQSKKADLLLVVVDATNLSRNLLIVSELVEDTTPIVIALNMIDEAEKQGIKIDVTQLQEKLRCPVVAISARSGQNIGQLKTVVANQFEHGCESFVGQDVCGGCQGCHFAARFDWAEKIAGEAAGGGSGKVSPRTKAIDKLVTHPVWGLMFFSLVGLATFMIIFWLAAFPMDWMDGLFGLAGSTVGSWIPAGDFNSFVTDGLIGGVGGMLIFLPQIMLLFFMISLLEDSGYLARAAFVMDRLLYRVGLPGKAFVPMLSAHACAIPAVMASRVIDDRKDRLKTILILPLMTCSARLPVYAMVVAILFPHQPLFAALTFALAYSLGIVVAIVMALVFKLTILPGETRHLVIELPPYRRPSLKNAFLTSLDRAKIFIKKAGTVILLFSMALWVLATYPKTSEDQLSKQKLAALQEARMLDQANDTDKAEKLLATFESENTFAGRIGRTIQPVFAPLGFDWKITVGVLNSFAAREVVVSTLAVLYGTEDDDEEALISSLEKAEDSEGRKVFDLPTCLSLLVFFVLAMQCLPTTAVVKRETGGWFWAIFQIVYMTVLAYSMAWIAYQVGSAFV